MRKMERGNSFSISRPTKFPKRMKTNTFLRRKTHLLKNSLEKNYPQNKKEEEPKPCTTTTQTTPLTYATMGQGLYKPLVFLPPHPSYDVRGNISLLTNQNTQDQIPFCLIRPSSASSSSSFSNWCVLYSHGNAEDLGQLEPLLTSLANTFQVIPITHLFLSCLYSVVLIFFLSPFSFFRLFSLSFSLSLS